MYGVLRLKKIEAISTGFYTRVYSDEKVSEQKRRETEQIRQCKRKERETELYVSFFFLDSLATKDV